MQQRSAHAPARNPPRHKSSHGPRRNQKEKDRPHNRRHSPDRVRTQRDGALPDSSTFRTLYFEARTGRSTPRAGSVTSECGLARFTRKVVHRVASHISVPRGVGARRMPIRWHLDEILVRDRRRADQSELKEFTAACEDELCRTASPAAQTETNPTSRTIRRQEIRIQVPPISRIIPPNLTAKNCQTDGQITRSKPDQPQSFGALGTGWGRAVMQGPVYAESSSYTRVKPPPQQNDSCSIFRTTCGKGSPKL